MPNDYRREPVGSVTSWTGFRRLRVKVIVGAARAAGATRPQGARIAATRDVAGDLDKVLHEERRQ
jgi:hypothetical protein